MLRTALLAVFVALSAGCVSAPRSSSVAESSQQVRAAETAFAKSMADRDLAAFSALLADDAIFINGGKPLKGKAEIVAFWRKFFEPAAAPFSWKPEIAEATAGGDLGYTEGPVATPDGKVFAKFYSTWRRSPSGQWLVVFDNGYTVCDCKK